MTLYRVRGALSDGARFEFDLEADDPWHVLARAYRKVDEPWLVTSVSVMPVGGRAS